MDWAGVQYRQPTPSFKATHHRQLARLMQTVRPQVDLGAWLVMVTDLADMLAQDSPHLFMPERFKAACIPGAEDYKS